MDASDRQRAKKYAVKALIYRVVSIVSALSLQTLYFYLWVPSLAGHILDSFTLALGSTIFINLFLIPIGIGYEELWHRLKHKIWDHYEPPTESHEHIYILQTGYKCECGKELDIETFDGTRVAC